MSFDMVWTYGEAQNTPFISRLTAMFGLYAMSPHIALGAAQILLVDDSEDTCDLMSMALSNEGFTVAAVNSGTAALQFLNCDTLPVCLLVDYDMPDMDGLALTEAVRERFADDIVVIAVTGSFTPEDQRIKKLFEVVDHHFFKPVDWKRLMGILGALKG